MRPGKKLIKRLMLAGARTLGLRSTVNLGALVLCHHRVDDSGRSLTVSPAAFRRQMTYLRDRGANWMTVAELGAALERGAVPPRAVCVTFDDAARSTCEPIEWLVGIGGRCTQFAVLDWLSAGTGDHMGWDQLKKLSALGVEIGSHTLDHPDLRSLEPKPLRAQLEVSRARLGAEIDREIVSLAYPFGLFDSTVLRAAKAAGYRWACTTQHVHATPGFGPWLIPRYEVFDPEGVAELFEGRGWIFYGALQRYMLLKNRLCCAGGKSRSRQVVDATADPL